MSRPRLALMSRSGPVLMSIDVKVNVSIHLYGTALTLYKFILKKDIKTNKHVLDTIQCVLKLLYIILTMNIIYKECFGERLKDRR